MKTAHDPLVCFCGDSTGCTCPCDDCAKRRAQEYSLERRTQLLARLHAAQIDIEDLADLVWMTLETDIERRIAKLANAILKEKLQNLTLVSKVKGF